MSTSSKTRASSQIPRQPVSNVALVVDADIQQVQPNDPVEAPPPVDPPVVHPETPLEVGSTSRLSCALAILS